MIKQRTLSEFKLHETLVNTRLWLGVMRGRHLRQSSNIGSVDGF